MNDIESKIDVLIRDYRDVKPRNSLEAYLLNNAEIIEIVMKKGASRKELLFVLNGLANEGMLEPLPKANYTLHHFYHAYRNVFEPKFKKSVELDTSIEPEMVAVEAVEPTAQEISDEIQSQIAVDQVSVAVIEEIVSQFRPSPHPDMPEKPVNGSGILDRDQIEESALASDSNTQLRKMLESKRVASYR